MDQKIYEALLNGVKVESKLNLIVSNKTEMLGIFYVVAF